MQKAMTLFPPTNKRVLVVSAFPDEGISNKIGQVFANPSSKQYLQDLVAVGIPSYDILPTYIFTIRPPKNVPESSLIKRASEHEETGYSKWKNLSVLRLWGSQLDRFVLYLQEVQPDIIVALDTISLMILSEDSVTKKLTKSRLGLLQKYRGSFLQLHEGFGMTKPHILFPMYSKSLCYALGNVWTAYEYDLKKLGYFYKEAVKGTIQGIKPKTEFTITEDFNTVVAFLSEIVVRLISTDEKIYLSVDIEHFGTPPEIDCIGIATSSIKAICIPFIRNDFSSVFTYTEELDIVKLLQFILPHKNTEIIGQNFNYDNYFIRTRLGINAVSLNDTQTSWHTYSPEEKASLAYMASLFLPYYTFWKDDIKEGDTTTEPISDSVRWEYNCIDTTSTFAVWEALEALWKKESRSPDGKKRLEAKNFQLRELPPILTRMQADGVNIDELKRMEFRKSLEIAAAKTQSSIYKALGYEINLASPDQVADMLYRDLGLTPPNTTKESVSGLPTSEEALVLLQEENPLLHQFFTLILEYRSFKVFINTFIKAQKDADGKLRTTYKINGTNTFRFASTKTPEKRGANLQNVSKGGKTATGYILPNLRDLIITPSPDEIFIDIDLDSADLRIVAALTNCKLLNQWLAEGKKPYVEVAKIYYNDPTITKEHPSYKLFKALCHALHYKGSPKNIAKKLGLPEAQVVELAAWYFRLMPEIPAWHKLLDITVKTQGFIVNPFGYKMTFLNKNSPTLIQQACAWIPQSTVGNVINRGIANVAKVIPREIAYPVLQVHDSCVLIGKKGYPDLKKLIEKAFAVEVPFKKPIIIPAEAVMGGRSWGSCENKVCVKDS